MKTVFTFLILSLTSACAAEYPDNEWATAKPGDLGLDVKSLEAARKYALSSGGSGMVIYRGKRVLHWGDLKRTYDLKSTSKSIGLTAMALALKDGKLRWSDKAIDRHPTFGVPPEQNRETGWLKEITLERLATQTAGFRQTRRLPTFAVQAGHGLALQRRRPQLAGGNRDARLPTGCREPLV